MYYRKEIDGLRAVAVLPVIFFHAGFPGFSGGYVGVDVFFVISGYLITSIIIEELDSQRFSILRFYERRARRILPALTLVLAFSTLLAFVLMPAAQLKAYSQSLVSVTTFSSNIYFYFTSGYFSSVADEKPLLHTWSLAIEEQYYLFFPLLLMALWSIGRNVMFVFLTVVAVVSLCYSQWLAMHQQVDANFYLVFSRAWELLAGSLLAFIPAWRLAWQPSAKLAMSSLGLFMILYAITQFDAATPFPSVYALVPVLGTCLLIAFTEPEHLIGRILRFRPIVAVGLISYSLYLWHQPLFAFLRLKSIGEPAHAAFVLAIILTFAFAYLSWRYVEAPFRNKQQVSKKHVFTFSAASIAGFAVIGLAGHLQAGFPDRFDAPDYTANVQFSPMRRDCHTRGRDYLSPAAACRYFGSHVEWAVLGDSHVVEVAYVLGRKLEKRGIGLLHLTFSGCPPLLLDDSDKPGCSDWLRAAVINLENNSSIKNVLVGFRHSSHMFGSQLDNYPSMPHEHPFNRFSAKDYSVSAEQAAERYWTNFRTIIERLLVANKTVYVLYPVPELPVDVYKALTPFSFLGSETLLDPQKSTPSRFYFDRNAYILSKLDSLPYSDRVRAIKPFEQLCDGDFCPAVKNGHALYFDDHHLSIKGAEEVLSALQL